MTSIRRWLFIGLLACAAQSGAAQSGAAHSGAAESGAAQTGAFAPVAHSALVTVEAATTAEGLRLHLRRTEGSAPLAVSELHVSVGGQTVPVTQQPDGSWLAAWPKTGAGPGAALEVVVTHDGIREVLDGSMPAAAERKPSAGPGAGSGVAHDHKQLWWWVLNIAIVLIAVVAISRRTS